MGWLSTLGSIGATSRGTVLWDKSVAAGAVIDSDVLDVTGIEALWVVVDNAGAAAAALTLDAFLDDGATAIVSGLALRTVGAGAKEHGTIGPMNAALGTAPTLNFALAIPLPTKVKLHLAAAGAATRRVTIYAR